MAPGTRERMIEAAIGSLQHHGLAGMSFTDVLTGSGAARGAIYHHFPGGKKQLAAEAAARNGADVLAHLDALPATSPSALVQGFIAAVRPVVSAASEGGGCAVAAVTVRGGEDGDELCGVAAEAFTRWTDRLAQALRTAGATPDDAAELASLLVTLLEGAQVLCRATGDLEPFERAARSALRLADDLTRRVDAARSRRPGQATAATR